MAYSVCEMRILLSILFLLLPIAAHAEFPAVGKRMQADFGVVIFELSFIDDKTMTFIGTDGLYKGLTDTVNYTAVKIRDGLYMVHWLEVDAKINVTHIEDFTNGKVWTSIVRPDATSSHLSGTWTVLGNINKN